MSEARPRRGRRRSRPSAMSARSPTSEMEASSDSKNKKENNNRKLNRLFLHQSLNLLRRSQKKIPMKSSLLKRLQLSRTPQNRKHHRRHKQQQQVQLRQPLQQPRPQPQLQQQLQPLQRQLQRLQAPEGRRRSGNGSWARARVLTLRVSSTRRARRPASAAGCRSRAPSQPSSSLEWTHRPRYSRPGTTRCS